LSTTGPRRGQTKNSYWGPDLVFLESRQDHINLVQVIVGQVPVGGSGVLGDLFGLGCTGDDRGDGLPSEQPRNGEFEDRVAPRFDEHNQLLDDVHEQKKGSGHHCPLFDFLSQTLILDQPLLDLYPSVPYRRTKKGVRPPLSTFRFFEPNPYP